MIDDVSVRAAIEEGRTALGIEFGSTRIKAVLTGEDNTPIATGGHELGETSSSTASGRTRWTMSRRACRPRTDRWRQTSRSGTESSCVRSGRWECRR